MHEMRSPIAATITSGRFGAVEDGAEARLTLAETAPKSLVQIAGWQDFEAAVGPLLDHLGLALPDDFRTAAASDDGAHHLFRLAPGRLLLASGTAAPALLADVPASDRLATLDITHGRWIVEATGPALEDFLHRLAPVDFREASLPAGAFVQTAINKVSVLIWRTGRDRARILFPTSSTRWLWAYITDVATPLGYEVSVP